MKLAKNNHTWVIGVVVWVLAALAIVPFLLHWQAPEPRISRTQLALEIAYAITLLICFLIYRAESRLLPRRHAAAVALMALFLTLVVNRIHSYNVDQVTNLFPDRTNEEWQEYTHNAVILLHPVLAPHSYRFLPNAIVRWMQMGHVTFRGAADIYRLLTGLLLFYAIYRFARLFTNLPGAILAMSLVAAVFPVTFEWYAGQLTDPLSHLSFVLAFIFLETENFALLFTTLIIGSFAKETVLALAGYYILFCRKQERYFGKAIGLTAAALVSYLGVRYALQGGMHYQDISGVGPEHMLYNLRDKRWPEVVTLTMLGLLFPLLLSWKETPLPLKQLTFYLMAVLFISSAYFSWLVETRNFVPLVIVLAVIAGRFFAEPLNRLSDEEAAFGRTERASS